MTKWAQANSKEINVSIRFDKNQIEDMVKGEPLPFGHNAHPTHWCRGTNIEACRPVPDGEKALDVEYEQMAETLGDHVIVWKKGDPPPPAKDYSELKRVITTYCALLYVLYTANCPLYIGMMAILKIIEDPRVSTQWSRFTSHFCAKLTYAIIIESNQFFSVKVSKNALDTRGRGALPSTTISVLLDKVRLQANLDDCGGFPVCWLPGRRSAGPRTCQLLGPNGVVQSWAPGA